MARNRFTGVPTGSGGDELRHPLRAMLSPPHLDERSHRGPHHVPQEPVCRNPEVPIITHGEGYGIANRLRFAPAPPNSQRV